MGIEGPIDQQGALERRIRALEASARAAGWVKRALLNGVGSHTFNGLDGDVERGYELLVEGHVAAGGVDRNMTVRLGSPATNTTNSRAIGRAWWRNADDTLGGPSFYSSVNDSGLPLGHTQWSMSNDIVVRSTILCCSPRFPTIVTDTTVKPDIVDPRVMTYRIGGFLYHARSVKNLTVDFGGGTFTGLIVLRPLNV